MTEQVDQLANPPTELRAAAEHLLFMLGGGSHGALMDKAKDRLRNALNKPDPFSVPWEWLDSRDRQAWIEAQAPLAVHQGDGPAVPSGTEPASVAAEGRPLSPDTRGVLFAIDGYATPRVTVAQGFRALVFLKPGGPITADQLIRIADELDP
jgi:hypothetical protein